MYANMHILFIKKNCYIWDYYCFIFIYLFTHFYV